MGEDQASPEHPMGLVASNALKSFQQRIINELGAKLLDQFVVVNFLGGTVGGDFAGDAPWSHVLLLGRHY